MSKGFPRRCRYQRDHLNLFYYHTFILKSNKTLRQALFAVHMAVVFWLHSKYLRLSDFFYLKKWQSCSDCISLHFPSKVFHPSFCRLLNGADPSCLGCSITLAFAVGFTGGKLSRWSFGGSFCPVIGTVCCSNSK